MSADPDRSYNNVYQVDTPTAWCIKFTELSTLMVVRVNAFLKNDRANFSFNHKKINKKLDVTNGSTLSADFYIIRTRSITNLSKYKFILTFFHFSLLDLFLWLHFSRIFFIFPYVCQCAKIPIAEACKITHIFFKNVMYLKLKSSRKQNLFHH